MVCGLGKVDRGLNQYLCSPKWWSVANVMYTVKEKKIMMETVTLCICYFADSPPGLNSQSILNAGPIRPLWSQVRSTDLLVILIFVLGTTAWQERGTLKQSSTG